MFKNITEEMHSEKGYSFIQIKLAILFIETLTHSSLNMKELDFDRLSLYIYIYLRYILSKRNIHEKELELGLFYTKQRPKALLIRYKYKPFYFE